MPPEDDFTRHQLPADQNRTTFRIENPMPVRGLAGSHNYHWHTLRPEHRRRLLANHIVPEDVLRGAILDLQRTNPDWGPILDVNRLRLFRFHEELATNYGVFYGPMHISGNIGMLKWSSTDRPAGNRYQVWPLEEPYYPGHTIDQVWIDEARSLPGNFGRVAQLLQGDFASLERRIVAGISQFQIETPATPTAYAPTISPTGRLTGSTTAPISSVVRPPNEANSMLVSDRTFGIELEVISPNGDGTTRHGGEALAALLNAEGVVANYTGYTHNTVGYWKVVTDATVPNGFEVVSPVLKGEAGLAAIRKVSKALVKANYSISTNCGFHVHVGHAGLTGREKIEVFMRYGQFEPDINWMVAKSRRGGNAGGTSCSSVAEWKDDARLKAILNDRDYESVVNHVVRSRYLNVNLRTFNAASEGRNLPTIEFRQHQGTIEADKIINWVKFLIAFVEESKAKVVREAGRPAAITITPTSPPRLDVLSKIKKTYRGQTTKSYLVAKALLDAPGNGYTREELSALVDQDLTQISVILQHFKDKNFGLVITDLPRNLRGASKVVYKLVPPLLGEPVVEAPAVAAEPIIDHWSNGVPQEVVTYLKARMAHFKQRAGVRETAS